MNRPRSANQVSKKLYLVNKGQEQYKFFIPPESLPSIQNKALNNYNSIDDEFNEELNLIKNQWDDLGITSEYRAIFINHIKFVSESDRKDIFAQEKMNLKKFKDSLLNLKKEINNRENNISLLKEFDKNLENIINFEQERESIDKVIKDVVNIIKTLRLNAVNIVARIIKVNQLSIYYSNSGKFDTSNLRPEYSYDPKYLYKMKDDLLFLKNSTLSHFIEMENTEIDPFLTCCAPVPNKISNNTKIKIPIPDDLMKLIAESRYSLLQETLLSADKDDTFNLNSRKLFINRGINMNSYRTRNFEEEKYKYNQNNLLMLNNNISIGNISTGKKNSNPKNLNMSRYIQNIKNVNGPTKYNQLFLKNSPNNIRVINTKRRFFNNNTPNNNRYNNFNNAPKKIIIEHEMIQSLTNEEFIKKLRNYKMPEDNNINNYNNINNFKYVNKEEEKLLQEEIENLTAKNNDYEKEKTELLKKIENLKKAKKELLKKIENLEKAKIELQKKIENLEKKAKEGEETDEKIKNKLKEMSKIKKEYEEELEKLQKMRKKKEYELNSRIEQLEKEKLELQNLINDLKEKINQGEIDKNSLEEKMREKIQNLENKLKSAEAEKTEKEKLIEKMEKEENERKKEDEMKYEEMERKLINEKSEIEEERKKLENENKRKDEVIKEKEDEIQKINSEKNKIEEDKKILENEIKIKDEKIQEKEDENLKTISEKNNIEEEKKTLENEVKIKDEKIQEKENENQKIISEKNNLEEENNQLKKELEELKKKNQELEEENQRLEELKKKNQELEEENQRLKEKKEIENNIPRGGLNEIKNGKESEEKGAFVTDSKEDEENEKFKSEPKKSIVQLENLPHKSVDFYRGNISNLVNALTDIFSLEKIPDFLKRAFLLNELIYSDEYYFKGIFPKIILSYESDDSNDIKGICSYYYEYNEDSNENLIIRINSIFAIDNYKEHISKILEFIKNNSNYNRIEVYLLYDKQDDKFLPNNEAKQLFQNSGFKWRCVVRDEKQQQRYIKLYYSKDDSDNIDENQKNINNFHLDNLSIVTINNENDAYTLKNKIDVKSNNNSLNKKSYNKFINPYPIYSLLYENARIKKEFINDIKSNEITEMKEKLWRFVTVENGWNLLLDETKKIKNINCDLRESVFKEIENYFITKEINCLGDFHQMYISKNFESNYSILIDDIYYNRISSDKIKILREKKTKSTFFLIPSNDNTTFFYISELNKKLKTLLIDSKQNVYEKFLEFQPSTQKELIEFSTSSYRDITYIPQNFKKALKTIYIPTFSINSHLFSYNFKEIEKNVKMMDADTNTPSYLTSVDEFLNIEFRPDDNIENGFSVIPVEGGGTDFIIKDSFIIGIFDNDIINNEKLPLLQFLYITKENFINKK